MEHTDESHHQNYHNSSLLISRSQLQLISEKLVEHSTTKSSETELRAISESTSESTTTTTSVKEKSFSSEGTTAADKVTLTTTIIEQDHNHNNYSEQQKKSKAKPKRASLSPARGKSIAAVTDHQHVKSERSVHSRYLSYLNKSQEEKDATKTDYTYAHSYSYSDQVSRRERFCWQVPNMSRPSIQTRRNVVTESAFLNKNAISPKIVINTSDTSLDLSSTDLFVNMSTTTTTSTPTKNTRSRNMRQFGRTDNVLHSTPVSSHAGVTNRLEFSDDDEDDELTSEQQVPTGQNGVKSDANGTYRATSMLARNGYNARSEPQLSEEEDEDITFFRRSYRYITTTVRNYWPGKKDNDEVGAESETEHNGGRLYRSSSNYRRLLKRNDGTRAYETTGESDNEVSRKYLLWSALFLLLPLLISTYWYSGLELASLMGSISFLPSVGFNSIWDRLTFASLYPSGGSPTASNYQDLTQFNREIQSLRSELERMKAKYEADRAAGASGPPPSQPQPDFDAILDRLNQLELKLISCCQKNAAVYLTEDEVKHLLDSKLHHFQLQYGEQLEKMVREHSANYTTSDGPANGPIDLANVQTMIKLAIARYDADKTGEVDFALESAGAFVVSTRCSESYRLSSGTYTLLGYPLWKSHATPRTVIQPTVNPGECWCFKGNEGRIAIQLSARIIPEAFTYEHIPVNLSRDGHIRSAPANFAVYGLKTVDDAEPDLLGEYRYEIDRNEPLQRFEVQNRQTALHTFKIVELVVKSNHGHPDYTCLYRLRVHGTRAFNKDDNDEE